MLAKLPLVKATVFPAVMYGCESWTRKMAERWRIDAFKLWCGRRFLRVPWKQGDQINPPKGSQPWVFIGRSDSEAEAPILWPPDVKRQLTGKAPDARKERLGAGEDGMVEDKMVGRPDWLNGHELEKTLGDSEWQGGLWATVHGATKSGTRLNDWTTTRLQTASTQAIYTCFQLQLPALFTPAFDIFFQQCPTFLAPGTGFVEDNFSTDWEWGMVWGKFKHITFIVNLISNPNVTADLTGGTGPRPEWWGLLLLVIESISPYFYVIVPPRF